MTVEHNIIITLNIDVCNYILLENKVDCFIPHAQKTVGKDLSDDQMTRMHGRLTRRIIQLNKKKDNETSYRN